MGYDMSTSNVVNPDLEAAAEKGLSIPDVILVDPPTRLALCLLACQLLSGPTCNDVTFCERVRKVVRGSVRKAFVEWETGSTWS